VYTFKIESSPILILCKNLVDDMSDSYDPREELKEGDKPNDAVDHDDDCDLSSL
jgi:hypothetical protein